MHNKLALTQSFQAALRALHRMSLSPKRYTTATAIEALQLATERLPQSLKDLAAQYGEMADPDFCMADSFRLSLKARVIGAWKRRTSIATVVHSLPCYLEVAPYEQHGLLVVKPIDCLQQQGCCMESELKARKDDLAKMRKAILDRGKAGREDERRTKALKHLIRDSGPMIRNETCRDLGDAIFAFYCPSDSVLLTTNVADHSILGQALGKEVEAP